MEKLTLLVVYPVEMTARLIADLLDRHSAALVLFARQRCDAAEDVVQEAFCKLATQSAPPHDPAAWLFRVVRNAALDAGKAERRRKRREAAVARPVRWFHESALDGLDAATAVDVLQSLPDEQREVIILRLWSDLTLDQIAAACDCSLSTAHRRYEAGIVALQERLGETCPKT
jgi:RNA polymerase sigma factor (sigma-70 family)